MSLLRRFRRLPDQLTLLRLLLAGPLWLLALLHWRHALGVGMAVAGTTDMLDGWLARRAGRTSRFGSQLDSVADVVLFCSIAIWVAMLRPEFYRQYTGLLLLWAGLGMLTLAVGWVRFRRLANLHLYSAKAAGVIGYLFALYMIMFDAPAAPFFYVALTLAFAGSLETLAMLLTRSRVDEHGGSILRPRPGSRSL